MRNFTKLACITLIGMLCILMISGCTKSTQISSSAANESSEEDKYAMLKSDVWNSIPENIKESLSGDWKTAIVSNEELKGEFLEYLTHFPEWENADKKITTSDVYKVLQVTFRAASNSMLGDLRVYVDPDSKKIIGFGPRA
ncbi:MAG: hypothetical protein Q8934_21000 [Bacillota bacterium]|nr:hypothetical protein [Bacillota bacterium]